MTGELLLLGGPKKVPSKLGLSSEGLIVFGCFWIPSYWSLLILEFLDATDFLGSSNSAELSVSAQVEIDLVKLEAQMISEGDLDEETERSENYTPSESIKETESLGRSGVSVLGTLSTNEALFQWFLHKTGHCSTDAAMSLRYYDLLKVKPSASEAEIKKAYYKEWKSDGFFIKMMLTQRRQPKHGQWRQGDRNWCHGICPNYPQVTFWRGGSSVSSRQKPNGWWGQCQVSEVGKCIPGEWCECVLLGLRGSEMANIHKHTAQV